MAGLKGIFQKVFGGGVNRQNADGETRLFEAARAGSLRTVHRLLARGADPNIADRHGMTALHMAAYWGELGIVQALLKAGASPNAHNGKGWTPLHSAGLAGGEKTRQAVIDALVKAGAKDDIKDKHGWTARDYMELWRDNAGAAEKLKAVRGSYGDGGPCCDKHKFCGPRAPRHAVG